jgi:arylsulfatase A-like enzyme
MTSMKHLKSTQFALAALLLPALAVAQESLPFQPTPSGSKAGPTLAQSVYSPSKPISHLPANAPNILIIMLDDVGPALPDTYGGPIHTPTLDLIAKSGISYNSFHNSAMCSPTRAALLTGRNQHRLGFGQIAELANDWDGYTGHWPATTASVAKVLGYYGYKTAAFGKWHNTPANESTSQGPFDRWPTGRLVGFDYFYGFLSGESSQWEPAVVENTVRLPAGPQRRLSLHHRHDRQGGNLAASAQRHCSRAAVLHVLGTRRLARAAPHLQGLGRQVQRPV